MRPFPPPNARRAGFSILSMLAAAMLLALPTAAPAQPQTVPPAAPPSAAEDNWLYAGSDIPRDLAWQFGELPNGLRYAVRHNGVPPGQVSIRSEEHTSELQSLMRNSYAVSCLKK